MALAGYVWPDAVWQLADLEYKCLVCDRKASDVISLKEHVHSKVHTRKLQHAGISEDPEVSDKLDYYAQQELPLREAAKEMRGEKARAFIAKVKEFEAGLSPEELKLHVAERKRKRNQELEASGGKKIKSDPYTCPICQIECEGLTDIQAHFAGAQHRKQAQQFVGGCMLCGVAASPDAVEHFAGKKHLSRIARLEGQGVDLSRLGLTTCHGFSKSGGNVSGKSKPGAAIPAIKWEVVPPIAASRGAKVDSDPYMCPICKVELTLRADIQAHLSGTQHRDQAQEFAGGCMLCAVAPSACSNEHFSGKKHTRRIARLQGLGLSELCVAMC